MVNQLSKVCNKMVILWFRIYFLEIKFSLILSNKLKIKINELFLLTDNLMCIQAEGINWLMD